MRVKEMILFVVVLMWLTKEKQGDD